MWIRIPQIRGMCSSKYMENMCDCECLDLWIGEVFVGRGYIAILIYLWCCAMPTTGATLRWLDSIFPRFYVQYYFYNKNSVVYMQVF